MNSFKYIEYSGDDAADVLVSLLMNLAHPELASGRGGGPDKVDAMSQSEIPSSKPVALGFQPNESDDEEGNEDE